MSKSDYPALRMRVERGRLVPAAQFDQERLDSYRPGATVMVRMTEEKDRVLVRKWFAIIGLVIKTCETPWKNKDEAHEAIKLALGIVNLSKTVSGQFMQYPKSLTELDDPEMTDALDQMTELLSRMTGVDVETLKKETAHIGAEQADNTDSGDNPSTPDADGSSPAPSASDEPEDANSPALSSGSFTLLDCAKEMLALATSQYENEDDRDEAFRQSEHEWLRKLPLEMDSTIQSIRVSARAVAAGKRTIDQARSWLSEALQVSVQDLGGKANG